MEWKYGKVWDSTKSSGKFQVGFRPDLEVESSAFTHKYLRS